MIDMPDEIAAALFLLIYACTHAFTDAKTVHEDGFVPRHDGQNDARLRGHTKELSICCSWQRDAHSKPFNLLR